MKKILVMLFLVTLGTSVFAQKSYVCIYAWNPDSFVPDRFSLSGDVPSSFKSYYTASDRMTTGELLNQLSQIGYRVEFVSPSGASYGTRNLDTGMFFLLSNSSSSPSNIIQAEKADDGSDVYEVSRYNLQGMPVNKNERGVQIVVYSNYTTKTIIVE